MSWVRFPVKYVFILAVIVLPVGPGPIGPPRPPRARLSHRVWTVTVTGQSWWTVTVTGRPKPGPGPQADSVHRDMHAGVNRNPSQDHGFLVRTELWPTTCFQAEFHESSRWTTRTSSSRIVHEDGKNLKICSTILHTRFSCRPFLT